MCKVTFIKDQEKEQERRMLSLVKEIFNRNSIWERAENKAKLKGESFHITLDKNWF